MSNQHERIWTDGEITELLEKAYSMGFDLEKGSELEQYTVSELDRLVNQVQ